MVFPITELQPLPMTKMELSSYHDLKRLKKGNASYLSLHEYRQRGQKDVDVDGGRSKTIKKKLGFERSKEHRVFEELRPLRLGAPSPPLTPDFILHARGRWPEDRPWPLVDTPIPLQGLTETTSTYNHAYSTVATTPISPLESATTNFLAKYSLNLSTPPILHLEQQTYARDDVGVSDRAAHDALNTSCLAAPYLANACNTTTSFTPANIKLKARKRLPHPDSLRLHQPPQSPQQAFTGSTYKLAISPFAWSGSDLSANIGNCEDASTHRAHRFTRLLSSLQLDAEPDLDDYPPVNKKSISEGFLFDSQFETPPPTPPTIDLDQFYSGHAYSRDTLQSYRSNPRLLSKSLFDTDLPSKLRNLCSASTYSLWDSVSERASCEDSPDPGKAENYASRVLDEMEGSDAESSQNGRSRRLWDDADTARLSIMRRRGNNSQQSGHAPLTDSTFNPSHEMTAGNRDDIRRTGSAPPTLGPTPPIPMSPSSPIGENPFSDPAVSPHSPERGSVFEPSPSRRPHTPSIIRTLHRRISQLYRSSSPAPQDTSSLQGGFEYASRVSPVVPRLDPLDFGQVAGQAEDSDGSCPEYAELEQLRLESGFEDGGDARVVERDNNLDEYEFEDMGDDLLDEINTREEWTDEDDVGEGEDSEQDWTDDEDAASRYSRVLDIVGGYEPTDLVPQQSPRGARSSLAPPPSDLPPLPLMPSYVSEHILPASDLDWTPDYTTRVLLGADTSESSAELGRCDGVGGHVPEEQAEPISLTIEAVSGTDRSMSPLSPVRSDRGIPIIWQQRSASPPRLFHSLPRYNRHTDPNTLSAVVYLDPDTANPIPASSSWVTVAEEPPQIVFADSPSLRREARDIALRSRHTPLTSSPSPYIREDREMHAAASPLFGSPPVIPQPAFTRASPAPLFGFNVDATRSSPVENRRTPIIRNVLSPISPLEQILVRASTAYATSAFGPGSIPRLDRADDSEFETIELSDLSTRNAQRAPPLSGSPVYPQRAVPPQGFFTTSIPESIDTTFGPMSSNFDLRSMRSTMPLTQSVLPIKNGINGGALEWQAMRVRSGRTPMSAHLRQNAYHTVEQQQATKRARRAVIGMCAVSVFFPPLYLVLWCGGLDCFLSIVTRRKVNKMPARWRRNVGWFGFAVVVLWLVVAGLSLISLAHR